jgi:cell wall-associated NlpC family hydrolase
MIVSLSVALAPSAASAAPSIPELRAEVARIQADVATIDDHVEVAAEAYNGAVYRLDQIQSRIRTNGEALRKARRDLAKARELLGARLRAAYMQPPPSRVQLILSSGSVSSFLSGAEAIERASSQDAAIVRGVVALRERTIVARRELLADQGRAKVEVASRARQRDSVVALLNRRQAVLAGAKGRLGTLLAQERARERRAAEAERRKALERIRNARSARTTDTTANASGASSGGSPSSGGGASAGGPAQSVTAGPASASNAQAARIALQYLGVPYVWGGATPSGFDCSGLASYAYAKVGKSVPHYTGAIWAAFPRVSGSLQPGDLVFFHGLGHMGIYIGGGQMVHAPHTGDVVKVVSLSGRSDYVGAVRP